MNLVKNVLIALSVLVSLSFIACGGSGTSAESTDNTEEVDKSGMEYTSAYVCPMHCKGSGSAEAGTCPVCKMDYVANADLKKSDHDHDHGHDHEHDDHDHDH